MQRYSLKWEHCKNMWSVSTMAMAHFICEVLRLLNLVRGIQRRQCVISISFISCCICYYCCCCYYYAMSCEEQQQQQQQQAIGKSSCPCAPLGAVGIDGIALTAALATSHRLPSSIRTCFILRLVLKSALRCGCVCFVCVCVCVLGHVMGHDYYPHLLPDAKFACGGCPTRILVRIWRTLPVHTGHKSLLSFKSFSLYFLRKSGQKVFEKVWEKYIKFKK